MNFKHPEEESRIPNRTTACTNCGHEFVKHGRGRRCPAPKRLNAIQKLNDRTPVGPEITSFLGSVVRLPSGVWSFTGSIVFSDGNVRTVADHNPTWDRAEATRNLFDRLGSIAAVKVAVEDAKPCRVCAGTGVDIDWNDKPAARATVKAWTSGALDK
jgi:hypothetical protein